MALPTNTREQLLHELDLARSRIESLESRLAARSRGDDAVLREAQQRLRRHASVLTELAQGEDLARGDFDAFIRRATEAAARTLGVARASVWLFGSGRSTLNCRDLYEAGSGRHSLGLELDSTSCPRYFAALKRGRGIAADDARSDPATSEFRESYLEPLGITSMLDAPLRRGGELFGVVCHEHVGSPRRWRATDVEFAASVADFVALALETAERRRVERLNAARTRVLELIATGRPLDEVLEALALGVEQQGTGMRCSVQLLDAGGRRLRHGAAPSLPAAFRRAIDAVEIGPDSGSCGTAAYLAERVVVADIAADPRWRAVAGKALSHGLCSCWSEPVLATDGSVLGTVAVYHHEPRTPLAEDLELIEAAAQLAGIAIERRRTDEQMRHLRMAIERASWGIASIDAEGRFLTINEEGARMFGCAPHELIGSRWDGTVHPDDRPRVGEALQRTADEGVTEIDLRCVRQDGSALHTQVLMVRPEAADVEGQICFIQDITEREHGEEERRRLEQQLRHSQKMDAIGQLAGGVAHDFNNLLTAILGNAEMLQEALDQYSSNIDPFVAEALREIGLAGQRAASLTRQLLAFGRKQVRQLEVLAPDAIVSGLEPMLRPLLGEHIRLDTKLDRGAPDIHVDPGQIEQVVMNLAINSRDAMPDEGTLEIRTSAADLDDLYVEQHPGARPGPHAVITVSDTGVGMSPETLEKMFEPFFTTKPVGKGTGLGLATVFGIVSQAGGHVLADSRPGEGTRIRVLIPAAGTAAGKVGKVGEATARFPVPGRGRETILLCEDERIVRHLARRILESGGYTVLEAGDGKRALSLEAGHPGEIDLLVTDTILPGMNGRALAEELVARRPGARVLYVSGYTHDVIASEGVLEDDLAFLQKPFSAAALLTKVRQILDTRDS